MTCGRDGFADNPDYPEYRPMSSKSQPPGVSEQRAQWRGHAPQEVSSSEFAGRFGHWAFEAQKAPIKVTNQKTGAVLGYFVSAREFGEFVRLRDRLPRALPAWEMDAELIGELEKPLEERHPELDHLMDD
jgi:hypothetical protein